MGPRLSGEKKFFGRKKAAPCEAPSQLIEITSHIVVFFFFKKYTQSPIAIGIGIF